MLIEELSPSCVAAVDEISLKSTTKWSGASSNRASILAFHPAALGLVLAILNNFSLGVAEIYWWHCSEQWTEALLCPSNPSNIGLRHASTTNIIAKRYIEKIFLFSVSQWSEWSDFSPCLCPLGYQQRMRSCIPGHGASSHCNGSAMDTVACLFCCPRSKNSV